MSFQMSSRGMSSSDQVPLEPFQEGVLVPVLPEQAPPPLSSVAPVPSPPLLLPEHVQVFVPCSGVFPCGCPCPCVAWPSLGCSIPVSAVEPPIPMVVAQPEVPPQVGNPPPDFWPQRAASAAAAAQDDPYSDYPMVTVVPHAEYFSAETQFCVVAAQMNEPMNDPQYAPLAQMHAPMPELPAQVGIIQQSLPVHMEAACMLPVQSDPPSAVLPVPSGATQMVPSGNPSMLVARGEPYHDFFNVPFHILTDPNVYPTNPYT